jgi:hypothetical protein
LLPTNLISGANAAWVPIACFLSNLRWIKLVVDDNEWSHWGSYRLHMIERVWKELIDFGMLTKVAALYYRIFALSVRKTSPDLDWH